MNAMATAWNSLQRRLPFGLSHVLFPGGSTKHDHYKDFGWPERLVFKDFHRVYTRNSLAAAAVDKTIGKTWQDSPELWESEEPAESPLEAEIRKHLDEVRFWQMCAEADKRSLVGRYSALILRIGDGGGWSDPVLRVTGGIRALTGVVVVWEDQLKPIEFDKDINSPTYGSVTMYEFAETEVGGTTVSRTLRLHPDRVLIWSDDGTLDCRSALEPGFNDLIDAEKVKGAGGEGFWKTARGAPIIEAPQGMSPESFMKMMGAKTGGEALDKVNEQIDNFQSGFDKGLMLGGMTATPLTISLPSPEHFFNGPVQCFASSFQIPIKILLGSQTGERASTEDAKEWAKTCNSRRVGRCLPLLRTLVKRFVQWGMLPKLDWTVGWSDLTEDSASEKMTRAKDLSAINAQTKEGEQLPFSAEEIREAAGYKAEDLPEPPEEDDDPPDPPPTPDPEDEDNPDE